MQLPNGFDPLCNFIASVKIFQKHCWSQYMSHFCKKYVGRRYISYTCVWNVGSHTRISTCILFKSLTKKRRQENALSGTWLKKSLTEKWNSVMVFCFQNCSDLQWERIILVIEKTFEAEGREFAKVLTSLKQFIQTVKGQNNFWNRMHFQLISRQI